MNDNDYDEGFGHGYTTALHEIDKTIRQHLGDRRSRFADHPGLATALTLITTLRQQPHTWDNNEGEAAS